MIFVTVGSQLPFDRLCSAIAQWARRNGRKDIFVQHGGSRLDFSPLEAAAFLDPSESRRRIEEASLVVSHAGTGTIIACLRAGVPIVVLPRRASLGETRNDHQVATARRFAERYGISFAEDEQMLISMLDGNKTIAPGRPLPEEAEDRLLDEIRGFVARGANGEAGATHAREVRLFGLRIDSLTLLDTLDRVDEFVRSGGAHQQVSINVDKIVKASKSPELRDIVNACSLVNVDGMPVIWASRLLGKPVRARIAGIDLFEAIMRAAPARGWRIYLLGSKPEVVSATRRHFERTCPGIRIVGVRDGYWKPGEELAVVKAVADARPDILFVALGSPRKEEFLAMHQTRMRIPFAMGVGGSFDVFAGNARRAPRLIQTLGLEWFYRFCQEPRRLFRRYFIEDVGFLGLLWKEWRSGALGSASVEPQHRSSR
jgi:N-acetylglucosaminyldiphosphoundecaprenol N-acetyl-beta-D-mannosaminyltransferase